MARRARWSAVTANVNGVRAAARRGGMTWLKDSRADVICLQEVRATHEQLHEVLAETGLDHLHVAHSPAAALGRSGVAVLSREPLTSVRVGLGHPDFDDQGRWIEADVTTPSGLVTVVSAYVHTGEAQTPRQEEKQQFLEAMDSRLRTLLRRAKRRGSHVLVSGDLNVAHHEVDIKNWKGNRGKAGFLPEEREFLACSRRARSGSVHLVVVARPGLRHRQWLADRLHLGVAGTRRTGHVGRGRQGPVLCRALERSRSTDRDLRRCAVA